MPANYKAIRELVIRLGSPEKLSTEIEIYIKNIAYFGPHSPRIILGSIISNWLLENPIKKPTLDLLAMIAKHNGHDDLTFYLSPIKNTA